MIVTDIKKQKCFLEAIYIDGEFVVNIDRETLLMSKIKVGLNINDEELYDLIRSSNNKRAKEKALYYLTHRDHSRKELIDKLKRTFGDEAAEFACDKMESLGFIDDKSFAKKYAHDLIFIKKYSSSKTEHELIHKGIDKDIAIEAIESHTVNSYDQLYELIQRKYQKYLIDEKGKRRTVMALQRLGYRWDEIKPVLDEFIGKDY